MNSSETGQAPARGTSLPLLLAILLVAVLLVVTQEKPEQGALAPASTGPAWTSSDDSSSQDLVEDLIETPAPAETTPPTTSSPTQTVHGQHVAYSLSLPANWTTQSIAMDGVDNLSASFGTANLAIMVQESKIDTSQEAAVAAAATLKAEATEFQSTKAEPMLLDGRPWLRFVIKCRIGQVPMGYQYYVYSGVQGTYHIVAWTERQNFDRDMPSLRSIVQTFRFPQAERHPPEARTNAPATTSTRAAAP